MSCCKVFKPCTGKIYKNFEYCVDCGNRRLKDDGEEHQTAEVSPSNSSELLNAISDVLGGMIAEAKKKHDSGDWPKKFLYAHEGIGLMKAVEVIEKLRKEYGI